MTAFPLSISHFFIKFSTASFFLDAPCFKFTVRLTKTQCIWAGGTHFQKWMVVGMVGVRLARNDKGWGLFEPRFVRSQLNIQL